MQLAFKFVPSRETFLESLGGGAGVLTVIKFILSYKALCLLRAAFCLRMLGRILVSWHIAE